MDLNPWQPHAAAMEAYPRSPDQFLPLERMAPDLCRAGASSSPRPAGWSVPTVRCWPTRPTSGFGWMSRPDAPVRSSGPTAATWGSCISRWSTRGGRATRFPSYTSMPPPLSRYAREEGWDCEIVRDPDEYGNYLARLMP